MQFTLYSLAVRCFYCYPSQADQVVGLCYAWCLRVAKQTSVLTELRSSTNELRSCPVGSFPIRSERGPSRREPAETTVPPSATPSFGCCSRSDGLQGGPTTTTGVKVRLEKKGAPRSSNSTQGSILAPPRESTRPQATGRACEGILFLFYSTSIPFGTLHRRLFCVGWIPLVGGRRQRGGETL